MAEGGWGSWEKLPLCQVQTPRGGGSGPRSWEGSRYWAAMLLVLQEVGSLFPTGRMAVPDQWLVGGWGPVGAGLRTQALLELRCCHPSSGRGAGVQRAEESLPDPETPFGLAPPLLLLDLLLPGCRLQLVGADSRTTQVWLRAQQPTVVQLHCCCCWGLVS